MSSDVVPLPPPETWVPQERLLAGLVQADAGLRDELAEALPDTIGEP